MENKLPCDAHREQLKTLFKQHENLNKRVDEMVDLREVFYNLDKNMALQSQLLQAISEHNKKQDERMDKQQEIIEKININLTELTEGQKMINEEQKKTNQRIEKLEEKVEENEDKFEKSENKNKIDMRDFLKTLFFKFIFPIGAVASAISWIINLIKG